jgi:hypothetical protein
VVVGSGSTTFCPDPLLSFLPVVVVLLLLLSLSSHPLSLLRSAAGVGIILFCANDDEITEVIGRKKREE